MGSGENHGVREVLKKGSVAKIPTKEKGNKVELAPQGITLLLVPAVQNNLASGFQLFTD